MDLGLVRAELERLFAIDELHQLARDVLGVEPNEVSDAGTVATFALKLAQRCESEHAVEALCDAMDVAKERLDARVIQTRRDGHVQPFELPDGATLGPYRILSKLGESNAGIVYHALDQAGSVRLKVLRPEATRDRRALMRFLTVNRLAARLQHWGLPQWLTVGRVDDRYFVAHQLIEGDTLAQQTTRMGPMPLSDLRPLFTNILETLSELHASRFVHGALHAQNVLLAPQSDGGVSPVLLDIGTDRLWLTSPETQAPVDRLSRLAMGAWAPEKLAGSAADPRADLYAVGVLLYEALSGSAPFAGGSLASTIAGHVAETPVPLSHVAPPGWISAQLDDLVASLLAKDPRQRPRSAQDVLQELEAAPARAPRPSVQMSEEDIEERISMLLREPTEEMARYVESAIDEGAEPARIAESFVFVGDQVLSSGAPLAAQTRRDLLLRAIRIYEKTLRDLPAAEALVEGLLEDNPEDPEASLTLVRLRRAQGKHEELIEALLGRSQTAKSGAERGKLLAQIGKIYEEDLEDTAEALVAYSTAFCEQPSESAYAKATERLAGSSQTAWSEVLSSCMEASQGDLEQPQRHALLVQMARWYAKQVARPDLALAALQTVVAEDPRHLAALEALADLYRTTQQWVELGTVLTAFADATSNPVQARDLRAEAGDILLYQLNEPAHARALYEQVLSEDPGHERAANSLGRVFELSGDPAEHARALEQRSQTLSGDDRYANLCRAGRIFEDQLHDPEKALSRYEQVLGEDSTYLEALQGADRCCVALGKHSRLLELLQAQLKLARTPREQVNLMERIAEVYENEFLDHGRAADVREQILDLEPTHDAALTGLGRNLRALKRWRDVVVVYERHMEVLVERDRKVALGLRMGEVFARYLDVPSRAIEAYDAVLKIAPTHPEALNALVELRAATGDLDGAMEAIESLAANATTAAERAAHHLAAARLLESAGDADRAIERYKAALDADPNDRKLLSQLRDAYARRGSHEAAVQLLEREINSAEGNAERGKLCGEMAKLLLDGLHQDQRAEIFAKRALEYDPANTTALVVLGDAALADEQFLTASKHYEQALPGASALAPAEAIRVHEACIEALVRSGGTQQALQVASGLLNLATDSSSTAVEVANLFFEHGDPQRAYELYRNITTRFEGELDPPTHNLVTFRIGEIARRIGDLETADTWLTAAADEDPSAPDPIRSLIELRLAQHRYTQAYELMGALLDLESDEQRVALLVRMGDLAASQLHDTTLASRSYLKALTEKRDDRKILMKLMQLYSEEKDWRKLVKVILKIAELVEDERQRAKYLHTAAMVVSREMGDLDQAARLLREALELAPDLAEARAEALRLARQVGDMDAVKELLKERIKVTIEAGENQAALEAMDELGVLYLEQFHRLDQTIAVAESALQVAPDDLARREHLAALYTKEPVAYFEKAVAAYEEILRRDPFRADAYRALRHVYTAVKWGDSTWCCCQALHALGQATTDEATFFRRLRSTEPTVAQARLDDDIWAEHLTHPEAVPLLTALFTAIQPAVATVCARPLEDLGYTSHHQIHPERDEHVVAQSLHYVAEVLGIAPPPLYDNANDGGMVSFLHATTPSLVLGKAARAQTALDQATAFISARQVTYFRPGFYVRHLIPTGTELRAWLFATLALFGKGFKVPPELELKAREPLHALKARLSEQVHRYLEREVVPRLLESGALDLKGWVAAVDLTADRAGLIMCNDLEVATAGIHGSESSVAADQRLESLFRYAVSKPYFALRRHVGTAVDL